jgi:cephalosporin hydroxylase
MLIVLDTIIDDLEVDPSRSWGPGASPKSAIIEFMKSSQFNFQNIAFENKSVLSVAPYGFWLKL